MVRIGLVVVAIVLVALMILGVGAGLGLLDISSHGIAIAHHDNSADPSSSEQPKVISADDLLRKKGLTFAGPAQTPVLDAPEPAPPAENTTTPQPAKTANPVAVVQKPADKPALANTDQQPQDPNRREKLFPDKQNPVIHGIEVIPDGLERGNPSRERRSRTAAFRIDAGSPTAVRDSRGNVWEADSGFADGKVVDRGPIAIANTDFPDIYRTERYEMTAWNQAVPNGKYTVNLHFAETSDHINEGHQRIFSVTVQGNELRDLNVAREAGGNFRALAKTFHVDVTDGNLSIVFKKGSTDDPPEINGIEVIPEEPIAIRIDAGSPTAIHDSARNTWEADGGFEGGQVVDRGPIAIANTDFPDLYRTEHYGMSAWRKRVPNGKYLVKLHFAETWDGITDAQPRIFHVNVQGNDLRDLNVAKEAGGVRRALVKTFHVTVTDGVVSVIFQKTEHNAPEINGIEVIQE